MKAVALKELQYGEMFTIRDYDDSVDICYVQKMSWIRCENAGSLSFNDDVRAFCVRWRDGKKSFFKLDKIVYTDPRL